MVDRRFWVGDGRQADFKAVFGVGGIWEEFLRRANGYIYTDVESESQVGRRYRVRDLWRSHQEYELFREQYAAKYEKLNELLVAEGLIERQQLVGEYYVDDSSDGDDLVSAEG